MCFTVLIVLPVLSVITLILFWVILIIIVNHENTTVSNNYHPVDGLIIWNEVVHRQNSSFSVQYSMNFSSLV